MTIALQEIVDSNELFSPLALMWNIIEFDELASTNTFAGECLARGEAHHGDVIVARHQTAGRGRAAGRVWNDEAGASLLMSIVLTKIPEPVHLLQYRVALAVVAALREMAHEANVFSDTIRLKWPNDILIVEKKVCGILLEAQWNGTTMHSAIAGIGVNVRQHSLPEELAEIATSLLETGIHRTVVEVRDGILRSLESELIPDTHSSVLSRLKEELDWMTKLPSLQLHSAGEAITDVHFEGIDDSGALLLRNDAGEPILVRSGSVTWNRQNR